MAALEQNSSAPQAPFVVTFATECEEDPLYMKNVYFRRIQSLPLIELLHPPAAYGLNFILF
ncbi:hypothetical protein [Methylocystis bryophila]|uniref:Uncharacterized protein n=1 Tax=Methylocystis bryophila TaxID=655015 RepID=A0A1W6MS96_9HYPH|nr:hypothetical protein [Methylocystis bryophila]ARN80435.1 hypothetical protein B1812_04375 [Methylocystis bryophila]BDV40446.1 hypothetical protein DSM21852_36990 [Methylocystis bryophila]